VHELISLMDMIDGENKVQRKTKTVRTKFSIPLCCFGANSQFDAEFNLTTNESTVENSDAAQTCSVCNDDTDKVDAQAKQRKEELAASAGEAATAASRIDKIPERTATTATPISPNSTTTNSTAESGGSF
jgi:hypothetical protein